MDDRPLPFDAPLAAYDAQAAALLAGLRARDPRALEAFRCHHPRFRDPDVAWLARDVAAGEVEGAGLGADDARLAVARAHSFADWAALAELAGAVAERGAVYRFEAAVEAVVDGALEGLERALRQDPGLARARSTRRTCFDPPLHRATLLHYVAANGVEGHRQRTPANAVDVARALLDAGAEPDALADFYGGPCATMSLLVSSSHPAAAGVQGALVELLLDRGAAIEGRGEPWGTPLRTALVFGCPDAARALERRGASVESLSTAAGLGRAELVLHLLPSADAAERHAALALAAQLGQAEVVRLLLDAGEDPDRHNPRGAHAHATPLHQAVWGGHEAVVRLLVERGARLDLEDTIYHGTPLGWALHAGREDLADWLRAHGAR